MQKYLGKCIWMSAIYFEMHKNGLMGEQKVGYRNGHVVKKYGKTSMSV